MVGQVECVSRTRVRAGLRSLAALGVVQTRQGAGTFITAGGTPEQMATISDELTGMYAALQDPQMFMDYDLRFHRAVAAAANNPMLGAISEAVAAPPSNGPTT